MFHFVLFFLHKKSPTESSSSSPRRRCDNVRWCTCVTLCAAVPAAVLKKSFNLHTEGRRLIGAEHAATGSARTHLHLSDFSRYVIAKTHLSSRVEPLLANLRQVGKNAKPTLSPPPRLTDGRTDGRCCCCPLSCQISIDLAKQEKRVLKNEIANKKIETLHF